MDLYWCAPINNVSIFFFFWLFSRFFQFSQALKLTGLKMQNLLLQWAAHHILVQIFYFQLCCVHITHAVFSHQQEVGKNSHTEFGDSPLWFSLFFYFFLLNNFLFVLKRGWFQLKFQFLLTACCLLLYSLVLQTRKLWVFWVFLFHVGKLRLPLV